jgi:hypothetical protein
MSAYIDINSKGVTLNSRYKVDQLVADGATVVEKPIWQENLICVINNPTFDIAIHCYSEEVFNSIKKEGKDIFCTWLIHPYAKLLSGIKE